MQGGIMPRSLFIAAAAVLTSALVGAGPQDRRGPVEEVPVTIRELDVEGAIREFQDFQRRLGLYREGIGEGRQIARETSQILDELRATASAQNNWNEEPIMVAVQNYIEGVLANQVELVDFLESQRYRISHYANQMAAAVRPEDLAILFGTVEQNDQAIDAHVRSMQEAQVQVADHLDALPSGWFDRNTFQPTREMPREERRELDSKLYRYQQERDGLELARKRSQLVRAAQRQRTGPLSEGLALDADLLIGQMFGALDRIRLQMSMDLLFFENLLGGYARSARTQEILDAFQSLVELQGDLEGPSPELAGVLDWLQDTSTRRITLGTSNLARPGLRIPRYSDLLREAYDGARTGQQ
jgi:hypothetical protein